MCRKTRANREDNKSSDCGLTSWATSEDQLTDFIIDKDEQGVREGAEPPVRPGKRRKNRDEKLIQRPRVWTGEHARLQRRADMHKELLGNWEGRGDAVLYSLERVHSEGDVHARAV